MDALVFCAVICAGIGVIALFVKIFNKGNLCFPQRVKNVTAVCLTFLQILRTIIPPVIGITINLIIVSVMV